VGTTVRAAVLREIGAPVRVEEIVLADPGPGQVRVSMAATGVCHSDLSLARGTLPHRAPVVLGHEGAGRVVALGDGVQGLREGDPVVLSWIPPCRECWFCGHAEPYLCARAGDATLRPYATLADGTPAYPGLGTAAFATQTVVGANTCQRLPDDVPLVEAALLGCAALTGVGAVLNAARVRPGESVVVFGLGGVGLCAVQGARIAGASEIIAVDPAPGKAELATRLGATHVLRPTPELVRLVRELTGGRGADHAVECVGRSETIREAYSVTRRGGRVTVVGLGSRDDPVGFNALELAYSGRTLAGCMYGNCDPATDIPLLVGFLRTGRLDLGSLVSGHITLDEVELAFADMSAGRAARSVIIFDDTAPG
jgi:S-(hydroxymethyl)glutathione dehydrogenase/alcohol dehydrogenase